MNSQRADVVQTIVPIFTMISYKFDSLFSSSQYLFTREGV